ncbi:hypothetical protein Lal_00025235 [Lupinus albus]|nr:hypothetical protein Lal_00025235 [Lupinus albus]
MTLPYYINKLLLYSSQSLMCTCLPQKCAPQYTTTVADVTHLGNHEFQGIDIMKYRYPRIQRCQNGRARAGRLATT